MSYIIYSLNTLSLCRLKKQCQLLIQYFFSIQAEGRGLGRALQNITMLPGCSGKFFMVFGGCLIYWWSNLSLLFSYKLINKSSSLVLYSSLVLGANLLRRRLPTDGPLKEYQ